jgi:hypothetical protein
MTSSTARSSGAVDEAVIALMLGAIGAAEDAAVGLHPVADDPAATVGAGGATAWIAHSKLSKVWVAPATMTWNALS